MSEDVNTPLVHLGGSYAYALSDTVAISLDTIGFALKWDKFDGTIIELDADVNCRVANRIRLLAENCTAWQALLADSTSETTQIKVL